MAMMTTRIPPNAETVAKIEIGTEINPAIAGETDAGIGHDPEIEIGTDPAGHQETKMTVDAPALTITNQETPRKTYKNQRPKLPDGD